jgi:molybdopterin-containing oxidoreductase family iron-sulfur binding subunit
MYNPEVTVRWRGVMEKCTYCIQRISHGRIAARKDNRPIRDGEIKTACQQACPANAIIFGDLNLADSQVGKLKQHPLDYSMLAQLNTRPRTTYLAKLRNPNQETLPGISA